MRNARTSRGAGPEGPVQALCAALVAAISLKPVNDPDLWWHLKTGDLIVTSGIPKGDTFSWTVPGRRWIAHEWLSQVLLWAVESVLGTAGLVVGAAGVVMVAFWIASRAVPGHATAGAALAVFGALVAAPVTGARPQMVNLIGLACVMAMVERIRSRTRRPQSAWLLIPLMVLWANMHSGFVLGFVVIGVYLLGDVVEGRFGTSDSHFSSPLLTRPFVIVILAAALGTTRNPNGIALWRYPFDTLRSDSMQTLIQEWQSPDFHQPMFWPLIAMPIAVALVLAKTSSRIELAHVLLLGASFAAALQSMRHVALFGIVVTALLSPHVDDLVRVRFSALIEQISSVRPGIVKALWVVVGVTALTPMLAQLSSNERNTDATLPVAATQHILDTPDLIDGDGWAEYGWGGWLIYNDIPVFIDGRADVYGDEFMFEWANTIHLTPDWDRPLETFGVDWILVQEDNPLAVVLDGDSRWVRTWSDEQAVIFEAN